MELFRKEMEYNMYKTKACIICKIILYFPLKECPECGRKTTNIWIEEQFDIDRKPIDQQPTQIERQ
jgi:transposase